MNNRKIISMTICWILLLAAGLSVISYANNESGTNEKAEGYFEKANELRKVADYEAAITEYNNVISALPNSKIAQDARYWIGQSYFEMGQYDSALSAFQKLLDEYPDSPISESTKLMIERVQQAKMGKSLLEATERGDIKQVKLLISQGVDVNIDVNITDARDRKYGMTPLYMAVMENHKDIAELLIDNGADINANTGVRNWTPLQALIIDYVMQRESARGFKKDMASLLISKGADVNSIVRNGNTLLQSAVSIGDLDIIKLLIDKGAKLDVKASDGSTVSHAAAVPGRKDIIELFVSKGADVSGFNIAAFMGDLDRVKEFVEKGTDVDVKDEAGWTALSWAICGGQKNVAEFLIEKGADVNTKCNRGWTPLFFARNKELSELLIDNGADVNTYSTDVHSGMPLHTAVAYGRRDIVELLINKGAEIDSKTNNGGTSLSLAAQLGNRDIAELLINMGAEIDSKANNGGTPLRAAAIYGQRDVAELLINKGADINSKDNNGRTPLHWAVANGHRDIIELLINKGAELNIKADNGLTPLKSAINRSQYNLPSAEIAELLRKHGAKE
jgi:ankyrin repeat protein